MLRRQARLMQAGEVTIANLWTLDHDGPIDHGGREVGLNLQEIFRGATGLFVSAHTRQGGDQMNMRPENVGLVANTLARILDSRLMVAEQDLVERGHGIDTPTVLIGRAESQRPFERIGRFGFTVAERQGITKAVVGKGEVRVKFDRPPQALNGIVEVATQ